MSNILPKKSWHVYNDKNREKVKKDETGARIEKERTEERAKIAEREHRLSLLRSRAQIPEAKTEHEQEQGKDDKKPKRFELFPVEDGFKDEIKGDYERDLDFKKSSQKTNNNSYSKKSYTSSSADKSVDHWKHDPMYEKSLPKKKSNYGNSKDYSFV